MDKEILKLENQKSLEFVGKITKKLDKINSETKSLQEESLKRLQFIREQALTYSDMMDTLREIQNEVDAYDIKEVVQTLNELNYLKDNPFFARIDLKDKFDDTFTPFYISKFGFFDGASPILIDWRAKLASIYYKFRYPQKDVFYHVGNEKFTYDMELKRTYEIENGSVLKYFNNDIQLSADEIIIEKIKGRTGGVLEDIVETIQESQMKIIESDPREVCIVQGCVGSGKSTVAIHKLSYIFFNYPEIIRPDRSILISKNRVLVDYLSSLFPKLGIFDLKYATTRDLIFRHLTLEGIKVKFNLGESVDVSRFNQEFTTNFLNRILQSKKKCFDDIFEILNKDKYQGLISYKFNETLPIFDNVNELLNEISVIISDLKEEAKVSRSDPFELQKLKDSISKFSQLKSELTSKRSDIINNHFNSIIEDHGISKFLGYSEALLYLIIFYEFYGFKKNQVYEYCVIDEAQDCSLIELLFLKKMVLNNRFCIIGDINQNLHNASLTNWEEIFSLFDGTKISTFLLETNYRSTKNIVEFANKIISPFTKLYLPKPIEKMGEEVITYSLSTDETLDLFRKNIISDYENLSKSIGVVFYNSELKEKIIEILKEEIKDPEKLILLEEVKKGFYTPRGIYGVDFDNCKGLEFNKVYLFGFDLNNIPDFENAKKAFVGVTRAMNELTIFNK